MIHPFTELRFVSSNVGLGVFATAPIPRGTVVWALDPFDLRLGPAALAKLGPKLREAVVRGAHIGDGGEFVFCWDHGRYVNHSCEPNCVDLGSSFEIASRTIEPGEELTCDYNITGCLESFACRCGRPSCRGQVEAGTGGDLGDPIPLAQLVALAREVAQPLLSYADPDPCERELFVSLGGTPTDSATPTPTKIGR